MGTKNNFSQEDLDPEIVKIRDQIISKIGNKPLDEINSIIKKLLNDQMDENTRLGVLAARLKIIRLKIETLYENKIKSPPITRKQDSEKKQIKEDSEDDSEKVEWIRIRLLEASNINGKQIDKGVIVDVKKDDGNKLISSKKAEELKKEDNQETDNDHNKNSRTNEKIDKKTEKKVEEQELELDKPQKKEVDDSSAIKGKKDLLKQHEEKTTEQNKVESKAEDTTKSSNSDKATESENNKSEEQKVESKVQDTATSSNSDKATESENNKSEEQNK